MTRLNPARRASGRRRRPSPPKRLAGHPPRTGPRENDKFPPNKTYFEIPIAIQDRSFKPSVTRPLALLEEMSMHFDDAPAEALLGTIAGHPNLDGGTWIPRMWMEEITENPMLGATEVWEFYNATADAHPMHVHEVKFQIVDRQPIVVHEGAGTVQVNGAPRTPELWENGFKDTFTAYPGEVTRIRAQFVNPGQFVWHCHIVEHEDNEMMRPYRIGPVQPGQPMPEMLDAEMTMATKPKKLGRRRRRRRAP